MHRRRFLASSALLAASSFAVPHLAWAQRRDTFTEIRRGVGIYENRGGTIGWLVRPDALVVVDSQFPEQAEQCWTGLRSRTGHDLDLLLNTHHHGDHTAGNAVFGPQARQVVGHVNVPELMQAAAQRARDNGREAADPVVPTTTYATEWRMDVGDEVVRMRHHGPAHTRGDSVIFFENANVVHMGDLMFNRRMPFIDLGSGASTQGWVDTLTTVYDTYDAETVFIFGHSNPDYPITGDVGDIVVMRDFFEALRAYVEQGVKAGKTAEALLAEANGTIPGAPNGFDYNRLDFTLQTVHTEMTS
ncbi:MAG: MBL fold metallo-hydrolase [Rhodothermales bacterium]